MRFPLTFQRQKGGGTPPVLGGDAMTTAKQQKYKDPSLPFDNVLETALRDVNGWPVQRVVAGWWTSAATPVALNANLYFWEEATGFWFLVNPTPVSMTPGGLYFFDTASIVEPRPTSAQLASPGAAASAGGMTVMLVLSDPGTAVNGIYNVTMGPDMSTVGN